MENEIKNPISVMLNLAKQEIEQYVGNIMASNKITPDLMIFVLESVQSELKDMDRTKLSNEINELNCKLAQKGEEVEEDADFEI